MNALKPIDTLKARLNADSVQEQFRNALGNNAGTFVASVIDLYNSDSKLQQCEPNALINEALRAATMKLPINKALGFAYILPFEKKFKDPEGKWGKKTEPAFVLGYKGLVQLALRTGQYKTINADAAYEGEVRSVNRLTGEIDFAGQRKSDRIVGYFAYIELINGFSKTLYVTVREMAEHARKYSKGLKAEITVDTLESLAGSRPDYGSVGWMGNFDEMAKKTVLRSLLSKYGYLSVEMQTAIADDLTAGEKETEAEVEDVRAIVIDEQPQQPSAESKPREIEPGY